MVAKRDLSLAILELFEERERKRKRKYPLSRIIAAILHLTRTGCQWRELPTAYPPFPLVFYYFQKWNRNGFLTRLLTACFWEERSRLQMNVPPRRVVLDSQAVQNDTFVREGTGVSGHKKLKGRKRHLLTDLEGTPILVWLSAANVHDLRGLETVLEAAKTEHPNIREVFVDQGYKSKTVLGEMKSKHQTEVIVCTRPADQKKRWVVERSFGWLNFYRRLSKDYEHSTLSATGFLQWAFIAILRKRAL